MALIHSFFFIVSTDGFGKLITIANVDAIKYEDNPGCGEEGHPSSKDARVKCHFESRSVRAKPNYASRV